MAVCDDISCWSQNRRGELRRVTGAFGRRKLIWKTRAGLEICGARNLFAPKQILANSPALIKRRLADRNLRSVFSVDAFRARPNPYYGFSTCIYSPPWRCR